MLLRGEEKINPNFCSLSSQLMTMVISSQLWSAAVMYMKSDALPHGIRSTILLNDGRIAEINGSGLISLDVLFPYCTHILVSAYLHVNACSLWPNPFLVSLKEAYSNSVVCTFPSSPLSSRPYGVTSRNIYDSWLAEDLSVHSSGMAHSVSDSNFSQY